MCGSPFEHRSTRQPDTGAKTTVPVHVSSRDWKTDVSFDEAASDATRAHRLTYDGDERRFAEGTLSVGPLHYGPGGTESREASIAKWVMGVAAVVLIIACANIVNLMLARAARRRREIAVRLALGGSRARVMRLLLVSAVLLALIGGAGAILIGGVLSGFIRHTLLPDVDWATGTGSARVLAFSLAVASIAGIAIGVLPAWRASHTDASIALRSGAHEGARSRSVTRNALMLLQSALAMLLLVGAGLFVRSLARVRALDLGVQADRVVVLSPRWPSSTMQDDSAAEARRIDMIALMARRIAALSDVEHVALADGTPFGNYAGVPISLPGRDSLPHLKGDPFAYPAYNAVTGDYFATLGTRILQGRTFDDADRAGGERVVVVGAAMAAALWPDGHALNQCVRLKSPAAPCTRVVGVVQDARRSRIYEDPLMQYYVPLDQGSTPPGSLDIIVRPRGDAHAMTPPLRALMREVDPSVRFVDASVLQDFVEPQA